MELKFELPSGEVFASTSVEPEASAQFVIGALVELLNEPRFCVEALLTADGNKFEGLQTVAELGHSPVLQVCLAVAAPSQVYKGTFCESIENDASDTMGYGVGAEAMAACWVAQTTYHLTVASAGNFSLRRAIHSDCSQQLEEFEAEQGRLRVVSLRDGLCVLDLVFQHIIGNGEHMRLSVNDDDTLELYALAAAAGPGASPGEQKITMRAA
eukprot:TRINITY_DN85347_c0_g1_i1.p1 TRINITY_DN85347_c0_g1~~TRINITY_DN85347_c0_g1_i1.p1  ORF type:complete len:234 (+),score=49.98 TRINITY_DN85347_c0_g1_i1:67-702(+)